MRTNVVTKHHFKKLAKQVESLRASAARLPGSGSVDLLASRQGSDLGLGEIKQCARRLRETGPAS